jgi:hypothetical protein
MLRKELNGRRNRHRRTVVTPHAINGNAGCHGKIKGRQFTKNCLPFIERLLALALDDFFTAIETRRGNMVTQMRLTRGRFDGKRRSAQEVMCTVHATLGRGLFVLLNGHFITPKKSVRFTL